MKLYKTKNLAKIIDNEIETCEYCGFSFGRKFNHECDKNVLENRWMEEEKYKQDVKKEKYEQTNKS